MTEAALSFVTDFADQAVILPLIMVVAAVLAFQRRWRVAGAWLVATCGVLATMLVLKLGFGACGWRIPAFGLSALNLRSPSGHTASAAVAYGGIAALLLLRSPGGSGLPSYLVAAASTALIGVTRVALGAHSKSEVAVAALVGLAGAALFIRLSRAHSGTGPGTRGNTMVVAGALAALILFHGERLMAERVIEGAGTETVRTLIPACRPA